MTIHSSDNIQIEHLLDIVKIIIPPQKNAKKIHQLGFWLAYWLIYFVFFYLIFCNLLNGLLLNQQGTNWCLIGVIVLFVTGILYWLFRGFLVLKVLLWKIAGREIYEINAHELKITKSVFGIRQSKRIPKTDIKDILAAKPIAFPFGILNLKFTTFNLPLTGPVFVTRKENKTIFLGLGLNLQQAERIKAAIKEQLQSENT
ncbi:MAG: hypothetical protein JEZ00_09105 [Anaerolineaceae bacterium]|nr:hypothetical protein [Anaerolineaceae bacterium]